MQHIQAHRSHVFLTAKRVYKLYKAVRFSFVDFSTRAERNADSLREVRLNRRLARDVYLGIAAVEGGAEEIRLGALRGDLAPAGPAAGVTEHGVVMPHLPRAASSTVTVTCTSRTSGLSATTHRRSRSTVSSSATTIASSTRHRRSRSWS